MQKFINRIFVIITLICCQYQLAHAQSTTAIPYQAVARTAAGNIVANQPISIRFSLLQGSASGTLVYQETHSTTTNSLGLFEVKFTAGTSTTGVFDPSKWQVLASAGAFLKTELDINGGSAFVDMGTTQLLSVPFAMYAEKSGATVGSVNYKGTWNANTNTPDLLSTGSKGDYYVVSSSGSHSLSGITDWKVGDWAIYNGTIWQKVDNSEATAGETDFTPNGDIAATNVQDAIVEVRDDADSKLILKQNALGFTPVPDTRTVNGHLLSSNVTVTKSDVGLGNVPNLDVTDPSNIVQDATHRFVTDTEKATWNGKLNLSGGTMTGNLILNADPTAALGAATKQYVDAVESSVSGKLNLAGGTMTGNLVLNANPTVALGAATKQYVDAVESSVSGKLNLAGGTMTGNLVLNANPTVALGAATKQYVDAVESSVSGKLNLAGGTMTGNLVLNANPTVALGAATKQYVDAGSDSYIHKQDDGVTIYLAPSGTDKRFGIGNTSPEAPLGIGAEGVDQKVLSLKPNILSSGSSYNFKLAGGSSPGLNIEEDDAGTVSSKIFIRKGGNVGINELIPDTKLHVSKPLSDPTTALGLAEGTGIMVVGPITNNIVADYRGIQARTGSYVGSTVEMVTSELNLQRLGGDILIHGDNSLAVSSKIIIKEDGRLGMGTINPLEKIDINGAIKIGDAISNNDGTIRFTGTDFEGRKGGTWVSLTHPVSDGFISSGSSSISYNPTDAKVGIGVTVPTSTLHVQENSAVSAGTTAALIYNASTTSNSGSDFSRVGLEIKNNSTWSSNAAAKNIGLYVSEVSGQANSESNIAAVLNGNVVVGGLSSSNMIGSGGKNVLAIQTGTVPNLSIGSVGTGGIQLFSNDLSLGAGSPPVSIFHVMNGDGTVIKLFRSDALTATDNTTISSTSYGTTEAAVINNLRTRIDQLEARLQALGLIL